MCPLVLVLHEIPAIVFSVIRQSRKGTAFADLGYCCLTSRMYCTIVNVQLHTYASMCHESTNQRLPGPNYRHRPRYLIRVLMLVLPSKHGQKLSTRECAGSPPTCALFSHSVSTNSRSWSLVVSWHIRQ